MCVCVYIFETKNRADRQRETEDALIILAYYGDMIGCMSPLLNFRVDSFDAHLYTVDTTRSTNLRPSHIYLPQPLCIGNTFRAGMIFTTNAELITNT